jgi:hypothetical protein
MGYLAVAMTCWLSAVAAERLTSATHSVGDADRAEGSTPPDWRGLYWHALNRNSY